MHSSQLAIYLMVMRCHLRTWACLPFLLLPPTCHSVRSVSVWDRRPQSHLVSTLEEHVLWLGGVSLPVHSGWRGAQTVIHQPHMALVQLQCQGVIVSLVKKDAIVLVSGHLGRATRVCGLGHTQVPTSPDPLSAPSSGGCLSQSLDQIGIQIHIFPPPPSGLSVPEGKT